MAVHNQLFGTVRPELLFPWALEDAGRDEDSSGGRDDDGGAAEDENTGGAELEENTGGPEALLARVSAEDPARDDDDGGAHPSGGHTPVYSQTLTVPLATHW